MPKVCPNVSEAFGYCEAPPVAENCRSQTPENG